MRTLEGQIAIITGGTRGIGRATAELFAACGATLALCARDQRALDATAAQIAASHGTEVLGVAADILDPGAMDAFVARVGSRFGRIDILVNNAGGSEQRQAAGSRQQVYAVDPLGGAYAIEDLTNRIEEEARALIDRIDAAGGTLAAIEAGMIQREIQESAYREQQQGQENSHTASGSLKTTRPGTLWCRARRSPLAQAISRG